MYEKKREKNEEKQEFLLKGFNVVFVHLWKRPFQFSRKVFHAFCPCRSSEERCRKKQGIPRIKFV